MFLFYLKVYSRLSGLPGDPSLRPPQIVQEITNHGTTVDITIFSNDVNDFIVRSTLVYPFWQSRTTSKALALLSSRPLLRGKMKGNAFTRARALPGLSIKQCSIRCLFSDAFNVILCGVTVYFCNGGHLPVWCAIFNFVIGLNFVRFWNQHRQPSIKQQQTLYVQRTFFVWCSSFFSRLTTLRRSPTSQVARMAQLGAGHGGYRLWWNLKSRMSHLCKNTIFQPQEDATTCQQDAWDVL